MTQRIGGVILFGGGDGQIGHADGWPRTVRRAGCTQVPQEHMLERTPGVNESSIKNRADTQGGTNKQRRGPGI